MGPFFSQSRGGNTAYVTAKSAVIGLMRSLAYEYAPTITVNAVAPGYIDTRMFRSMNDAKEIKRKLASVPLQRIGIPEDIAYAVTFLASEEAGYITGQCLHVNGGMYLG